MNIILPWQRGCHSPWPLWAPLRTSGQKHQRCYELDQWRWWGHFLWQQRAGQPNYSWTEEGETLVRRQVGVIQSNKQHVTCHQHLLHSLKTVQSELLWAVEIDLVPITKMKNCIICIIFSLMFISDVLHNTKSALKIWSPITLSTFHLET